MTVVKTLWVTATKGGWYYKLCSKCSKAAKGDTIPVVCPDGHETHAINLRLFL
jgi:hypothetical protein